MTSRAEICHSPPRGRGKRYNGLSGLALAPGRAPSGWRPIDRVRTGADRMKLAGSIPLTAVCMLALAAPEAAQAQWGVNLPRGDFTWVWGDQRRAEARRGADFNLSGSDRGFHCQLHARLRPSSRLTRMDVRQIENDLRTAMSFVDAVVYTMNGLDYNRHIDWAVLDCEDVGRRDGGSDADTGPQSVTAWIELDVRLREEFPAPAGRDGGYWTAGYTQAGAWRFRRSGSGRRASYTIRSERLLLPGSLENVEGSAEAICHDGAGEAWRTEWRSPVEAEPVSLTSSSEGGRLVLWANLPRVWMQHPGHGHIAAGSECRTAEEPFRDQLSLDAGALDAAGAEVDEGGAFRLVELTWEELAEAAQSGEPVTFTMSHEASPGGRGMLFEIRGSIGQRTN
jgi:hypothetical protein